MMFVWKRIAFEQVFQGEELLAWLLNRSINFSILSAILLIA